jgi:hypothetical protein
LFLLVWLLTAVHAVLFSVLYACVVLRRINDAGIEVKRPGFFFRQQRYVETYLSTLAGHERSRWYNIYLKHSIDIALALSTALLFIVVAGVVRGMR